MRVVTVSQGVAVSDVEVEAKRQVREPPRMGVYGQASRGNRRPRERVILGWCKSESSTVNGISGLG